MSTPIPSFDEYRSQALARGYDEVLERVWEPHTVVPEHTHPFDADAVVVQGEMWLEEEGHERRLLRGDTFTLQRGKPHAERYGSQGATYWVARRN